MSIQEIEHNLNKWYASKVGAAGAPPNAGIEAVGKNIAAIAQAKAKQNAIWQDWTHDARDTLQGNSFWESRTVFKITLGSGVDYGVYLELAHDRKYAILEKTLNSLRGEAFRNIKRIMDK